MPKTPQPFAIQLPKDALKRVVLGQSFAEYDLVREKPDLFVVTPAVATAAKDATSTKCFFVGRRGTGKTATTYYIRKQRPAAIQLHPQVFDLQSINIDPAGHRDTRQRPFKTLQRSFEKALILEGVRAAIHAKSIRPTDLPAPLSRERNAIEATFDDRFFSTITEMLAAFGNDKEWLKLTRRINTDIPDAAADLVDRSKFTAVILLDRIDEAWDGSERAVILLAALMHACVEIIAKCAWIRPKLFLRENIFERVRECDNEFARLETSVVSMDWSREQLLELVERRLALPFSTKLPLRGPTWNYFFPTTEEKATDTFVFDYCQHRPRDVLSYCTVAVDIAVSKNHERVGTDDLIAARRRFSESRLKDLGDEYAENYPSVNLVLQRFFGLGTRFTLGGVESFIKKLLVDESVKRFCQTWIYNHSAVEQFIHLFYGIGFFGLSSGTHTEYRSVGTKASVAPPLTAATTVTIHPSYVDALGLQDLLIGGLGDETRLKESGIVDELPHAMNLEKYKERLAALIEDLKTLPTGPSSSTLYETLVGEALRLCFFRSLHNIQPQETTIDGRVRRDWIASNRAQSGFWAKMRELYGAGQVLWECKNYENLEASDFHQFSSYMTKPVGRLLICSYRGENKEHYFQHIKRIANSRGEPAIVLLVTDRDMAVFLRQSLNGKLRDDHLEDIHDRCARAIS